MRKRVFIIMLSLFVGFFSSTLSYSQDVPVTTEEEKEIDSTSDATEETTTTDDTTKEVTSEGDVVATEQPVEKKAEAKIYSDGVTNFVNSQVLFKLSSKDNYSMEKIEYKIDNGAVQTYQNPFGVDVEGIHTISFYGVDKIGNKEEAKIFYVTVDNTAPEVKVSTDKPIIKIGEKMYISKAHTFSISANDQLAGVSKVDYTLNTEKKEYLTPFRIVSDGDIELKVESLDNVNNTSTEFNFVISQSGKEVVIKDNSLKLVADNTNPSVTIQPSAELLKKNDNRNIAPITTSYQIQATDNESGLKIILYRVDGKGDFKPYINEIKFKTNGEHSIEAKAVDNVGNESEVSTLSVFVDTLAPKTKIDTIPE